MKTFIIEGNELCGVHTGMQRFICECLAELDQLLAAESEIRVYIVYPFYKKIHLPQFQNIQRKPLMSIPRHPGYYKQITLPWYLKRTHGIYCGLANNWPISSKNIICLHDIGASKPECGFSAEERAERLEKYKAIAQRAKVILTVSETSKNDIIKELSVEPERIQVVYNGWEHMQRIASDETVFDRHPQIKKKQYLYALGSVMPHKNLKWIIEQAKRNPQVQFVIAGNMHELGNERFEAENIEYLGYISDEENKALMEQCKLFVQPSKMEGFGIPPLEALSCGAKIAVSNASCLPEIYEDCAAYFDPDDYTVSLDALLDTEVADPKKLFDKYSWKKSAQIILNAFKTWQDEADRG